MRAVEAVTLDFYNTLAFHRTGRGRGSTLIEYLSGHGFDCPAWEHRFLYEIFARHHREYPPSGTTADKRLYRARLARRVFECLGIETPDETPVSHAETLWKILGPEAFGLFPDVRPALARLGEAGLRLAVISTWQHGLGHFIRELGFLDRLEFVLVSAETGLEKQDGGLFREAARRFGVAPSSILHVGDIPEDDVHGATAAGLKAVLLMRDGSAPDAGVPVVSGLPGVVALLGLGP